METKNESHHDTDHKKLTKKQHIYLLVYIITAIICITAYFLFKMELITLAQQKYNNMLQKVSLAGFLAIIILSVSKFIQIIITKKAHTRYKRYNLLRLTNLVTLLMILILAISFLFANWYAAAVSLGLISLITGFALQTPISSFIGWIYIIARNPYGIGDRIQIGTVKGDVVEIGYLDTTLWEFSGENLTNDLPSGRLVRFPNSMTLQNAVFNYSLRDFNFIWNEIPFHVAYDSDLDHVENTIKQVAVEELGPEMGKRIEQLKNMVKESPINEKDIKDYPFVSLKISPGTWIEATLTYLVSPKQAASVRSRIIKLVIKALAAEPGKAMAPKNKLP